MDSDLRRELIAQLRYFDGHSDTLGLFAEPGFPRRAGVAPAEPFRAGGCGGRYAGLSLLVDQLEDAVRRGLERVVYAHEVGA